MRCVRYVRASGVLSKMSQRLRRFRPMITEKGEEEEKDEEKEEEEEKISEGDTEVFM